MVRTKLSIAASSLISPESRDLIVLRTKIMLVLAPATCFGWLIHREGFEMVQTRMILSALFLASSLPLIAEAQRRIPDLDPLVGEKIDVECVPRRESVSHITFVFSQLSEAPITNYQEPLAYKRDVIAEFLIRVFWDEEPILELYATGKRPTDERFRFLTLPGPRQLTLLLDGVVDGGGMLQANGFDGLPGDGFFMESVVCNADVQQNP